MVITNGKVRVFVYGSLKRGQCNNVVLEKANAQRVCRDSITGMFEMMDFGPYPAILERKYEIGEEESVILGEVYAGDEEMLAALDMLEGHPHFFKRRKVWCDREKCKVWVYIMNSDWKEEAETTIDGNCWHPSAGEVKIWGQRGVTLVEA